MDRRSSNHQIAGHENHPQAYPSDVSDEEWGLVAPYLALLPEKSAQRGHPPREVFNGLRYIIKTGAPWRWMPNDLPPWAAVYQQARRWLAAGCFEALADDLRAVLRQALGRSAEPSAAILDSQTLRASPQSGSRAGYGGAKRKKGSRLPLTVDTLGNLLALHVTPASTDDRAKVGRLTRTVQAVTGDSVDVAFVDQGYNGPHAASAAEANGIERVVVKLPEAKKGFVLLPRRWVVERFLAWATRFRRLVKDYQPYASTLAAIGIATASLTAHATDMASGLGTVLGAERGCGLIYDQTAVAAFIDKLRHPMTFRLPATWLCFREGPIEGLLK